MLVIALACITIIEVHLNLSKYKYDNVIKWDITSYYSYLPATFIDKDVSLKFVTLENNNKNSGIKYWYIEDEKGNRVIKYTMGMAVLYAPFFFIAHLLASPLGYANDGFSGIYECMIDFSGLIYIALGLWYLRKLLLQFYSEKITALTLLLVFFGTNLLYYTCVESAMSHAYTFSIFSIFLYYTHTYYHTQSFKPLIITAICFGIMVLIRPLNILFILPFLLYNVLTLSHLKKRLLFFTNHYRHVLVFVCIFILIIAPQLLYYKYVTGNWLIFSYGNEKFYFSNPQILNVLFSFRKGWYLYTPIMLIATVGIFTLYKQNTKIFISGLLALFPLYVFLISSWRCWWYGGSFGQRTFIDIYPLLAIPLGSFIYYIHQKSKILFKTCVTVLCLLMFLNIFQTFQYKYNIIDYDGMTKEAYWQVFGSMNPESIKAEYLKKPNYEAALNGQQE